MRRASQTAATTDTVCSTTIATISPYAERANRR